MAGMVYKIEHGAEIPLLIAARSSSVEMDFCLGIMTLNFFFYYVII